MARIGKMASKRISIVSAAEDDPIYREGWSVSIPQGLKAGSGMQSADIPARPNRLTPEQQKLSALEQAAILHRLEQEELARLNRR